MLGLLVLILAATSSAYEAPDDCELNPPSTEGADGFSLTCHLSAINSRTERTNFSVIPAAGTASLVVRCSDSAADSALEPGAFADLAELRELAIEGCRLSRVPRGAFLGLDRLRKLTIRTASVESESLLDPEVVLPLSLTVDEGAFAGLPSLQVLDLSGNGLRSLPSRELCSLPELQWLQLSDNRLGSLGDIVSIDGESDCLNRLNVLDASSNEISSLTAADLPTSASRKLKELNLGSNFISLVSGIPASSSLRLLDLSGNRLSSLPGDLFANASASLNDLILANNSITEISGSNFRGLKSLQSLDLSGNGISNLEGNPFSDLSSLLRLDLSGNQIDSLQHQPDGSGSNNKEGGGDNGGLFATTLSLEALRLDGNRLRELQAATFSPLRRLRTLDLSRNALTSLSTPLSLPALTHLHLSGNAVRAVHDDALRNCSSVLVLDLSHNRLSEVPPALSVLRVLQTLDLSHNQVRDLSGAAILGAEKLWRLQLSHNRLTEVTADLLKGLRALQVLDLSGNAISRVERGAFDANELLQALRLDGNRLTDIVGLFHALPGLNWLNVSDNAIETFDYALLPRSLHWLDVSHNRLEELGNYHDATGDGAVRLSVLDASFNRLRQLGPGSVPDSVETLLVNDNAIAQIVPYTFFKKKRLRKVDLTVNALKTVDRNALRLSSEVERLPDFFLGGNPIECDCEMVWFKTINAASSLQNYPLIQDIESIYCRLVYTREVSFVPLVEARNEQFLCPYETHCFALCKCCDFDACDCEMSCPDNCTCYHDNSWSKNIAVCSSQGFQSFPDQLPMDSTEIFLDGNELYELDSHTFIGRKNLRVLHLNNSQIHTIQNKTFNGLKSLSVLHLEGNKIDALHGYEFEALSGLRELYLQDNAISFVASHTFKFLRSLEVLHLHGNRVIDFSVWQLAFNPFLVSVRLADNLWSCDCEFMERFRSWMSVSSSKIFDAEQITCVSNEASDDDQEGKQTKAVDNVRMADFDVSTCASMHSVQATTRVQELMSEDYLPLLAATLASFALVLFVLLAAFLYRHTLRVFIHSKYGVRVFDSSFSDDGDNVETGTLESGSNSSSGDGAVTAHPRLFDVFVSYSPKDERFVREVSTELEGGNQSYQLCLHHRDVPADLAYASDTVVRAAAASRRTVLILSENFLRSEWSRFDYKSGLHQALRSGSRRRLLVITVGDVNSRDLDPDLRLYLKTSIVLPWGDRLFWEKLRYALPDVPIRKARERQQLQQLSGAHLASNLQQAAANITAISSNNNIKPVGVTAISPQQQQQQQPAVPLPLSSAEGHYYHQPRYATYLPPPPPSSVSSPAPSIGNNNNRMLPSPPLLMQQQQQQQHLYSPGGGVYHMPNLPAPQTLNSRNVVMHI